TRIAQTLHRRKYGVRYGRQDDRYLFDTAIEQTADGQVKQRLAADQCGEFGTCILMLAGRRRHAASARLPEALASSGRGNDGANHRSYFQFRLLPSAIQPTAASRRLWRVSSAFASVTHSTYSRRWLGLKPS